MSEDRLRVAHQLRLGAIADAHPRQFRLFEIAVDPKTVGIDHGNIADTGDRKVSDPQQEVGDVTVDGTDDVGPLQVQFRLGELVCRCLIRGFRLHRVASKDLLFLGSRGKVGQTLTPCGLDLLDLEVCGPLIDQCLAHANSHFEVERIDDVKDVALVDELVVGHPQLDDLARYLRRDVCDLNADAAIPRPGRGHIVLPCEKRDQDGDQCDGERRKAPSDRAKKTAGVVAPCRRGRRRPRWSLANFLRVVGVPCLGPGCGGAFADILDTGLHFSRRLFA